MFVNEYGSREDPTIILLASMSVKYEVLKALVKAIGIKKRWK